jgi:hypothetical protein
MALRVGLYGTWGDVLFGVTKEKIYHDNFEKLDFCKNKKFKPRAD